MRVRQVDWKLVVADTAPRLFRYFTAGGLGHQAEDLTQETLIRVVRKVEAGEFDSERAKLRTYAFGIARFVRLEAMKSKFRLETGDQEMIEQTLDESLATDDQLIQERRAARLRQAITTLKPDEQEVILLMLDQDLTYKEISGILGMPENTVKSHMRRAKTHLKQILGTSEGVHP